MLTDVILDPQEATAAARLAEYVPSATSPTNLVELLALALHDLPIQRAQAMLAAAVLERVAGDIFGSLRYLAPGADPHDCFPEDPVRTRMRAQGVEPNSRASSTRALKFNAIDILCAIADGTVRWRGTVLWENHWQLISAGVDAGRYVARYDARRICKHLGSEANASFAPVAQAALTAFFPELDPQVTHDRGFETFFSLKAASKTEAAEVGELIESVAHDLVDAALGHTRMDSSSTSLDSM